MSTETKDAVLTAYKDGRFLDHAKETWHQSGTASDELADDIVALH